MRITWDSEADAAYICLTASELHEGRHTVECPSPDGLEGSVLLDWKDGKIVGIEVLSASNLLHEDLLAQAVRPPV